MLIRHLNPKIEQFQEAVGGYVEAVTGAGWHAYLNEDGKVQGLPPNPRATRMLDYLLRPVGTVVGTVLFLGSQGANEADVREDVLDVARALGEVREEE